MRLAALEWYATLWRASLAGLTGDLGARYQYARMLRDRNAPGDAERARALLSSAAELGRELSLHGLVSLCERAAVAGPAARHPK